MWFLFQKTGIYSARVYLISKPKFKSLLRMPVCAAVCVVTLRVHHVIMLGFCVR